MHTTIRIMCVVVLLAAALNLWAAEPTKTGTVVLTLAQGVAPALAGERDTRDMELELSLRDGKLEPTVWGYAIAFNKADHEGRITSAAGDDLVIKMTLNPDPWSPRTPGEAEYRIALKRQADAYTGTFIGTLSFAGSDGPVRRELKGTVTGAVYPSWTEPVDGFKKLAPNEHPRLIFRKSDLPVIRKRLETPEGKAIMARFLEVLPNNYATHDKCKPYYPAGYGLAYQLTGDKAYADKAQEILAGMLGVGGSQDIHYGPEAQSIAITLDLCYDAWDPAFRQQVIDNLAKRLANLATVTGMGGASLNPWHNHEGVRAGSAGVAAICLLGEKTGDGKAIPDLDRLVHVFARSTRRYFQYSGTSNTGWCLEGNGYKRMTWNSGPGHMVQAYRTALGGDLLAGCPGQWATLGEWMQQRPSDKVVTPEGLGDDQYSGLYIMGLTVVPDAMKAGARWLFDHAYGLEGDKTFGLLWAYHAGYLLMNYPFDTAPRPPADSLPWVAPDPNGGHWIFRKSWQGANDALAVLHLRNDVLGGCHWENSGRTWDMQLFALGRQWIGDRTLVEKDQNPGAALPTVANPDAYNKVLSAKVTDWHATADGKAVLSFDMTPIYLSQLAKGATPAAGLQTVKFTRQGTFIDQGVRVTRSMALDFSGACGAPVLIAVVDKATGASDFTWNLKLAKEAGAAKVEGNTVTVGDPAGENLKCTFITPTAPNITGGIAAKGGDAYFAVITVQKGAAPALTVQGQGFGARVSVGGQTLRFDGANLVLEK